MTLGFEQTGRYRCVLAVDHDSRAVETFRENFNSEVFAGPVQEVPVFPNADVVIGGPPCQGFSPLNMAGVGLERRGLWREYLRALDDADPLAFVMENVPGLLRSAEYAAFRTAAEDRGFLVEGQILNAADFGVPQRRRRAIVIGVRDDEPRFPRQSHFEPGKSGSDQSPWRTFRDAVLGLPLKPDGNNWHSPRNPAPISLERYRTIPNEGEGRFELADRRPDITPACWLRKKKGTTDVFGRLWWDRPTLTIRTEFHKPEKGRYLHPSEDRPITLREGARCMSFPDKFLFPNSQPMTEVAKQIGNAVPPVLAGTIADCLADQLDSLRKGRVTYAARAA